MATRRTLTTITEIGATEKVREEMGNGDSDDMMMLQQPKLMPRSLASSSAKEVHQDFKTRRRRMKMLKRKRKVSDKLLTCSQQKIVMS